MLGDRFDGLISSCMFGAGCDINDEDMKNMLETRMLGDRFDGLISSCMFGAGCDILLDPIRETIAKRAMTIQKNVQVVPAQLGNTAGVIGASLLIKS